MSKRNSAGSSSQSHFSRIPSVNVQRSVFDMSKTHKTTFDAGLLIPYYVEEVLPGDTFQVDSNLLIRLATPIFPYMDNVYCDVQFFFVPNRLVWENWERFNGAQDDPGDSTDFLVPQLDANQATVGFGQASLYDYLGLPTKITGIAQDDMPNALVLRAYNLIWNEWYRDENFQNSQTVLKDDGPDNIGYLLLPRGRRKDYFTSALPWPQKGPSVLLPLGSTAPVINDGNVMKFKVSSGTNFTDGRLQYSSTTVNHLQVANPGSASNGSYVVFDDQGLQVDLSDATAATINELREAFQVQRLFERDARGGTRYVEILLSHFGVTAPDFRLQRPEYLGGGTTMINVNPIAQTSETTVDSPQGNLAAFAQASGRMGFNKAFQEHGHVIGLISARADMTYQQGMSRMWSRRTRYDFYWPTLAHLGEQTVLNKEIYFTNNSTQNNAVFGYQERFAEYRYSPSMVTGLFRSNATGTLQAWHLALNFSSLPTVGSLVVEDPPIDRIIAVPSEPQFIMDSYTRVKATRPIPTYSIPGLIDHF